MWEFSWGNQAGRGVGEPGGEGGGGTSGAHEVPFVFLLIRVSRRWWRGVGEPPGASPIAAPLKVE